MSSTLQPDGPECPATGVLCALPEELGGLRELSGGARVRQGLELFELELEGQHLLACVSGVGKAYAARAAAVLLAEGAGRLLVVGTCGGLRRHLVPGTLVACERAVQADLGRLPGREVAADAEILSAWRAGTSARAGWFLTRDRPVLSLWRRFRLARAFLGDCVADMETAAVAAVAEAAGVPWGALRAVTDRATWLGSRAFRVHYPVQAPRAADTIPDLLRRIGPPERPI